MKPTGVVGGGGFKTKNVFLGGQVWIYIFWNNAVGVCYIPGFSCNTFYCDQAEEVLSLFCLILTRDFLQARSSELYIEF